MNNWIREFDGMWREQMKLNKDLVAKIKSLETKIEDLESAVDELEHK